MTETEAKGRVLTDAEWSRLAEEAFHMREDYHEVKMIRADRAILREATAALSAREWEILAENYDRYHLPEAAVFRRLAEIRRALGEEGDGGE